MKRIIGIMIVGLFLVGNSYALNVTASSDGGALTNTILGTGITASNVIYNGAAGASGTFTDGLSSGLGIASGIIITNGTATDAVGPNFSSGTSTENGFAGDSDLDTLITDPTNDATYLSFDFVSDGGDLFFNYVFASEEYNEFVDSFNDVFGFFMDGVNIALIPGTTTPVSIDNVNLGDNSGFYNNNDADAGSPFDLEYDGFTDVFTASVMGLTPGSHTIKLAIADAIDQALDSAVFIQTGSFSDEDPNNPVPEPSTIILLGGGLLGLGFARRKMKK